MSSKSSSHASVRIVLVDPLGDVLFSGESLSARAGEPGTAVSPPDSSEAVTERCPQTMRSAGTAGSGVYRAVDPASSAEIDASPVTEDAPLIEDVGAQIRHVSSKRGGGRAA